jgi:O-antigen ligase
MSTAIENIRTIPTRAWLSTVVFIDSVLVASLFIFRPPLGVLGLISLTAIVFLAFSQVGLVATLCLISHINSLNGEEFQALRALRWLIMAGMAWITVARYLAERRRLTIRLGSSEKALLGFIAWGLFCSLFAVNQLASFLAVLRICTFLLVYIVTRETIASRGHVRLIMFLLLFVVLSSSVYSFSGMAAGQYARFSGFLLNPNSFGILLNFCIPVLLVAFLSYRHVVVRVLFGSGILLGSAALLLSWSRASWLAMLGFVITFLLLEKKRKLLCVLSSVALVAIVLLALSTDVYSDFAMLMRLDAGTTRRTTLWHYALQAAVREPVVGYGYDVQRGVVRGESALTDLHEISVFREEGRDYDPHNFYLLTLLTTGIPGAILILLVYYYLFKSQVNGRRKARRSSHRLMHTAVFATLVGCLLNSMFESGGIIGSGSSANYLWLMLGLTAAVTEKDIEL